jgi:hypothetical protein
MDEAQEIDYAYHADRLLLLIARRSKLPAGSDQIPALDKELISTKDLVRSYRLVRAHEQRKIAGRLQVKLRNTHQEINLDLRQDRPLRISRNLQPGKA